MPAPPLDEPALVELIAIDRPEFIKWDARPGNAIARGDGAVAWFDWEHCGARNRLDDVAWLLGDEYTPDLPAAEDRLLAGYLGALEEPWPVERAREYLWTYGSLHACVRLGLILYNRGEGPWWDAGYCLERDKVGVTLEAAERLCGRAARWAAGTHLLAPLGPWFEAMGARLDRL